MNPIALATLLAKLFGIDSAVALKYARIIFLVAVCLIIFVPVALIYNCKSRNTEKKIEKLGEQILEGKINANISAVDVQEKANITNKANANLSNVVNRNVNSYNGNANNVLKRFECEVEKRCE